MNPERYKELDESGKGMTTEESAEGWHFCQDWDQMLIGPGMFEYEHCCGCKKP